MTNVGIVGAGLQGRRRSQALKQSRESRLVAVADVNQDAARILAQGAEASVHVSWKEVTSNKGVDAVIICTPPNSHAEIGMSALENGKHVLCEKPLAMNTREALRLLDAAQDNRVKIKTGFNHRHHPALRQAKAWVDRGTIGELVNIRCVYGIGGRPGYDKEWRADPLVSGGGQLMDQGMHLLDLCRWFMGEFSEVTGYLATSFWDMAPLEDNAFVLMRTEKGQIASIHASWTQWKNTFRFEVTGKDGYVVADGLGGSYGAERAILGKRAFLEPFREDIIEFRGEDRSWFDEWQEFENAIRDNREPSGNGHDGLQALKLSEAVYQAYKSGCSVKVGP